MYGSIGRLGVTGLPMATNQAIAHAIPQDDVELWWLFYALLADRERLQQSGSGVTQSNISQTVLKAWEIPLPPHAEQRRIVADLERQMAAAGHARRAAEAQLVAADALPTAILRRAFGGAA